MAIETVLLALRDETDREALIELAVDIAGPTGATAVIGIVYDRETHSSTGGELNIASPDDLAERDEEVADVVSRMEEEGISTDIRAAVGEGGEPFVQIAEQSDADLVLIQGQSRSPAGKAVFGSVPQDVLLKAPCPVTFLRQ